MTIPEKIVALRRRMAENHLQVYLIGSSDPHQNEYISEHYKARQWLSGFSGSAGTLAVSASSAGLWVDSRYWLEAESVLKDSGIQLFCQGKHDVPTITQWIASSQPGGAVVSYDATCMSLAGHHELHEALRRFRIQVEPGPDLLDGLWADRPALGLKPIQAYQGQWLGANLHDKLERLMAWMQEESIQWYLISATDEIAWTLNLRGQDVDFNPIFHAWLLVSQHGHVLFVGRGLLSDAVLQSLNESGVSVADYNSLDAFLQTLPSEDQILLPPESTNMRTGQALAHLNQIHTSSPLSAWKAAKAPSEQIALRDCLERDGLAMVKFLFWLHKSLAAKTALDEYAVGLKIAEFRSPMANYVGESFPPIVGFGPHGAIVHYRAPAQGSAPISGNGLLLIDCGGQYQDGTTDMTRVLAIGKPSPAAIAAYTRVLKGHIRLATALFPHGTAGGQLDILARLDLWSAGQNYGHGTGHGIGFFLNVHEGPQRISPTAAAMQHPLEVGNVLSNEPGFYQNGEFGVRIENMVLVQEDKKLPGFLCFETLTLCPFDRNLMDIALLSHDEISWINQYNDNVYKKLVKHLTKEEAGWLQEQTKIIA